MTRLGGQDTRTGFCLTPALQAAVPNVGIRAKRHVDDVVCKTTVSVNLETHFGGSPDTKRGEVDGLADGDIRGVPWL